MPYNLIPASNIGQWKEALTQCGDHDIYHLPEYHQVLQKNGEGEPWLLACWYLQNYAALPLLLREETAQSAYGYPGLLCSAKDKNLKDEFNSCLKDFLEKREIKTLFIRQNPFFDTSWLFDENVTIEKLGHTIAIDLTRSTEEQLKDMTKGHRYDIRKPVNAGVEIKEDYDFKHVMDFSEIYCQTMKRNGARDYYLFPLEYYWNLKKHLGHQVRLLFATQDGKRISGAIFFMINGIIQYHLSGTRDGCEKAGAAKLIIDYMRKWGTGYKQRWLHLGGGLGADEESSLFRFKAGFSKTRLPFEVVRWEKKTSS